MNFNLNIPLLSYIVVTMTSLVAQTVKRLPTMQETRVRFLGGEDLLEKEMASHSSTLAWKIHGWRSLVGYSPWGRKESDTTERLPFPLLVVYPWLHVKRCEDTKISTTP